MQLDVAAVSGRVGRAVVVHDARAKALEDAAQRHENPPAALDRRLIERHLLAVDDDAHVVGRGLCRWEQAKNQTEKLDRGDEREKTKNSHTMPLPDTRIPNSEPRQ